MTDHRVIVVDVPGEPVQVVAYAGAAPLVRVELTPLRAVHLAGELIAAATRRLGSTGSGGSAAG